MKIRVLSDIHLEFGPFEPPKADADIVVLAGDISQWAEGIRWAHERFPHGRCIYVAGNHEFYGHEHKSTVESCRWAGQQGGVSFLENDCIVIDGIRFIGTTLWADYRTSAGAAARSAQ